MATDRPSPYARCHDCLAQILWAETPGGKRIPVNHRPSQNGTLLLLWASETGLTVLHDPGRDTRPRYLSHLATCPEAKRRRGSRKPGLFPDPPAS